MINKILITDKPINTISQDELRSARLIIVISRDTEGFAYKYEIPKNYYGKSYPKLEKNEVIKQIEHYLI